MLRSAVTAFGAGAGLSFFCYAVYYDYKRHNESDFKQKLQALRKRRAERAGPKFKLPDLTNKEETQMFFMTRIQEGEQLLKDGQLEDAMENFAYGVALCSAPERLLNMLCQQLPSHCIAMLRRKLVRVQDEVNAAAKKLRNKASATSPSGSAGARPLPPIEDELE